MKFLISFFIATLLLVSCSNESRVISNYFLQNDAKVPVLLEVSAQSDTVMKLTFDEEVKPFGKSFDGYEVSYEGCSIYVTLPSSLQGGESMTLSARVQDLSGNTTAFSTPIWGYNPTPASLLINEFTLSGTERQPQRTELYVKNGGYISGLCLYSGTPDKYDARVVLPSIHVNSDSYIVVWWIDLKTFQTLFEINGKDYCIVKDVINVCGNNSEKLPASNGVQCLTISPSPGAAVTDAVVYSKKSATKYSGFGNEDTLTMAKYINSAGQWKFEEVDAYYAADVSNSTATRSVSRLDFADTDSADDWFITVTGGFTFGSKNGTEKFIEE